jgi:hypothetical protein
METPRATTEMCFYETYQVVALKRGRRSSRYASAHPLDRVAVPHARERVPGPGRSRCFHQFPSETKEGTEGVRRR